LSKLPGELLGPRDVTGLCRLVTAAEKNDHDVPATHKIEPIAWPKVDAHLADTLPDGLNVAEIAKLHAIEANGDALSGCPVSEAGKPSHEFISAA